MAVFESVPDLLRCLCEQHIKQDKTHTNYRYRWRGTKQKDLQKRKLKIKAYEAIFQYLKIHEKRKQMNQEECKLGVLDKLNVRVYELRYQRHYEDALKMEGLLEKLCHKDEMSESTKSILEFLVCLQDTGKCHQADVIGHCTEFKHEVFTDKSQSSPLLLDEVLSYGDTKLDIPVASSYMHYPRDVFEGSRSFVTNPDAFKFPLIDNEVFLMKPGSDFAGREGPSWNPFECRSSCFLFGALSQCTGNTLEMHLDLPELSENSERNFPDSYFSKQMEASEDEGFVDAMGSSGQLSLQSPTTESYSSIDIWEEAMTLKPIRHRTWETAGIIVQKPEKPYLTEAGPEAFDHILQYHLHQLHLMDPSLPADPVQLISTGCLINDFLNLLIGLPSNSFLLVQDKFHVREGLCVSGISPEALNEMCRSALQCGTDFQWLSQFAQARLPKSTDQFGLVLEAFRSAIRKYLYHYEACILHIVVSEFTLLEVVNAVRKPVSQLRFLAQLCLCDDNDCHRKFPVGCQLLTYLYEECLALDGSEHGQMMLSLLRTTCAPYLIFIEDWVFHGLCRDHYGEFMLKANELCLRYRDECYWTEGYTLIDQDPIKTVPSFLSDLAYDIFLCGKSINLLKLCSPQHFLLTEEQVSLPRLCLTFSKSELSLRERDSQVYLGQMQAIARQRTRTRQDMKIQEERAKHELMARAHKTAAAELQRLQDRIIDSRRKADEKKRRHFNELKEQVEQVVMRKEKQKAKEKEEDRARMEALTRQELLEAAVDSELEKQAKEELIEYYAKLGEEALKRERRAMWRVHRFKLEEQRVKFFLDDEIRLQEEIQKASSARSPRTCEGATEDVECSSSFLVPSSSLDHDAELQEGSQSDFGTKYLKEAKKPGQKQNESQTADSEVDEGNLADQTTDALECQNQNNSAGNSPSTNIKAKSEGNQETGENLVELESSDVVANISDTVEAAASRPHIKMVPGQNSCRETEERVGCSHLKTSLSMNSTSETRELPEKYHLKIVSGKHNTFQSKDDSRNNMTHIKMNPVMNATTESREVVRQQTQRNVFGHISQTSRMEFDIAAPRLKRPDDINASKESSDWNDFSCFQVRPYHRKEVEGQSIDKESFNDINTITRTHIKMNQMVNLSTESAYVDVDAVKTERFRTRNVHGHSSDSSVQNLLYGKRNLENQLDSVPEEQGSKTDPFDQFWVDLGAKRYNDDHKYLDDFSIVDLMPWRHSENTLSTKEIAEFGESTEFTSLPFLISRSIRAPLTSQISLINQNIVNYFLVDLEIENHFLALHRFLMLQDGEFSQTLCNQLFDRLASSLQPSELFNPMFLNTALRKAMASSLFGDSVYARGISFVLKSHSEALHRNAPDALGRLGLTYKVEWPVNIIINESCLKKYGQIFNFMLKLRRAVWVLNEIFHRLKRDAIVHSASNSDEFRKLQLYRHEMQHFVQVVQEYIASEVIHVSWHEFQHSLGSKIDCFDDLIRCHANYLNKCLTRCLLNKKASPIMKIINHIFGIILTFSDQLISHSWQKHSDSNRIHHPIFGSLTASYQTFHNQSKFLFKVVGNIARRGYQPHFQDLLVRLGFNDFYKLDRVVVEP